MALTFFDAQTVFTLMTKCARDPGAAIATDDQRGDRLHLMTKGGSLSLPRTSRFLDGPEEGGGGDSASHAASLPHQTGAKKAYYGNFNFKAKLCETKDSFNVTKGFHSMRLNPYIDSTPTFSYFNLYFNTAYAAHYVYLFSNRCI